MKWPEHVRCQDCYHKHWCILCVGVPLRVCVGKDARADGITREEVCGARKTTGKWTTGVPGSTSGATAVTASKYTKDVCSNYYTSAPLML